MRERDTKKVAHSLLVLNLFSHTENWRVGGGRLVNKAINMTRTKRQTPTSSETPRQKLSSKERKWPLCVIHNRNNWGERIQKKEKKELLRISNFKQSQPEIIVMQESIKVCTMTIKNKVDLWTNNTLKKKSDQNNVSFCYLRKEILVRNHNLSVQNANYNHIQPKAVDVPRWLKL